MAFQGFAPSYQQSYSPPPRHLVLRKSPVDSNITLIHPDGSPIDTPPLFSIENARGKKCNIRVFQGYPNPNGIIGEARTHGLSFKNDISLRGQSMKMKMSQLSGDFTVKNSHMGELKWKINKLTGCSMQLCDASGTKLAKVSKTGKFFSGDRKLEILVSCDMSFCELVVLTGMAAKITTETVMEAAAEIGAAAGGAA